MARIPRIAAAFRGVDQEELQAELAVTLLHLRRKQTIGIRNWKSYLAKSLLNRASKLAKHWRRQGAIEVGYDPALLPEDFAHHIDEMNRPESAAATEMKLIRRRLSRRSFEFLRLLDECHGSISALARKLG